MAKKKELEPKIENIIVLAKLNTGKIYNVLLKKETQNVVLNTINLCEGGIQLLDNPVESVDIVPLKNSK